METWDVIRARRNVREYTDQPIPRDDLERILEAGRRSPSSSNWKPWHFVVVTDRDSLVELAKAWPRGGAHIARSAATIALVAEQPEDEQIRQRIAYDLSQATVLTMITVTDLGIGSGHSAVRDQEQGQRVLGFPDHFFASYMIGFGYPADRPLRPVLILSGVMAGVEVAAEVGVGNAGGQYVSDGDEHGVFDGTGGDPAGVVGRVGGVDHLVELRPRPTCRTGVGGRRRNRPLPACPRPSRARPRGRGRSRRSRSRRCCAVRRTARSPRAHGPAAPGSPRA